MTDLLGSKRFITAVAATGAVVALSGCALLEPAGPASPSAGPPVSVSPAPGEAPGEVPTAGAPATPPEPASSSASASASPPASPSASAPADGSGSAVPSAPGVTAPAAAGACSAAQLTGAVEDRLGGGGAGSVHRTLVLTNASDVECSVDGYPGVSFVDAAGTQLGAPADRDGSAPAPVTLAPGASATTTLQQTNAQNYGADCGITPATGLRVYPPGATDSLVLPQEIPACSAASIVLMTVGPLQPAA